MPRFIHEPTKVEAFRLKAPLEFPRPAKNTREAEAGDWGIRDLNGRIYAISDEMFRKLYRPAPGDDDAQQEWDDNGPLE